MPRYKIWDKKEPIFTIAPDHKGKACWTPEEYFRERALWASNPNTKVVIGGGKINGTVFMEFEQMVEQYTRMGAEINSSMTDDEILATIEAFEDTPQIPPPSPEERIAAAMEYDNLMKYDCACYDAVKYNFQRGLWNAGMVAKAHNLGVISKTEYDTIISIPNI